MRIKSFYKVSLLPFFLPVVIINVNDRSVTGNLTMTNNDIIAAAFKVWGRDFYRTTSLTDIARELRVSKPALYRHFKDKDALLGAMNTAFFDDCADFLKSGFNKAVNAGDSRETYLLWIRTMAEYYLRNREALIFSLIRNYNGRDREALTKEFSDRGIDFGHPAFGERPSATYPSKMQLSMATLIFFVAQFHHQRCEIEGKSDENLAEDQVGRLLLEIEGWITKGIRLNAKNVAAVDYPALERQAAATVFEDTEVNALLRAAAEAVAEAGPWETSMEMVARRSGLSKSGLYAHFKNKQDMLSQLFITEFTRIINHAKVQIETSSVFEDQLYLAIISIVDYLRSRPEIFVALDWIKTGRLDLGKEVPPRLYGIIKKIEIDAIRNFDQHLLVWMAQWILFMIVNTLALWPPNRTGQCKNWEKNLTEIPNECFRVLFRFIALGLEDLN